MLINKWAFIKSYTFLFCFPSKRFSSMEYIFGYTQIDSNLNWSSGVRELRYQKKNMNMKIESSSDESWFILYKYDFWIIFQQKPTFTHRLWPFCLVNFVGNVIGLRISVLLLLNGCRLNSSFSIGLRSIRQSSMFYLKGKPISNEISASPNLIIIFN